MDPLTADQIEGLAGRLREERARLEARLDGREMLDAGEDPGDHQDAAAEHAHRTQESRMVRRDQDRLLEVVAALARVDSGTYGICLESDEPIPWGRLSLDPAVRYTVDAQEDLEADEDRAGPADEEAY